MALTVKNKKKDKLSWHRLPEMSWQIWLLKSKATPSPIWCLAMTLITVVLTLIEKNLCHWCLQIQFLYLASHTVIGSLVLSNSTWGHILFLVLYKRKNKQTNKAQMQNWAYPANIGENKLYNTTNKTQPYNFLIISYTWCVYTCVRVCVCAHSTM